MPRAGWSRSPINSESAARLFARIVVVDWSAAADRGPRKPQADRCWLAVSDGGACAGAEYFRTRHDLLDRLTELAVSADGPILMGFDFPFGYPSACGLGGGRSMAERLKTQMQDNPDGGNNRFAVAAALNRHLGKLPGPFWGKPPRHLDADLPGRKPNFGDFDFAEHRIVEARVRAGACRFLGQPAIARAIMSVWQLNGVGSVGGQVLTGLAAMARLIDRLEPRRRVRLWPFETDWDAELSDVVLAEVWPSLAPREDYRHAIKDANQVMALCDLLSECNLEGRLRAAFACPSALSDDERRRCLSDEGWILGLA